MAETPFCKGFKNDMLQNLTNVVTYIEGIRRCIKLPTGRSSPSVILGVARSILISWRSHGRVDTSAITKVYNYGSKPLVYNSVVRLRFHPFTKRASARKEIENINVLKATPSPCSLTPFGSQSRSSIYPISLICSISLLVSQLVKGESLCTV